MRKLRAGKLFVLGAALLFILAGCSGGNASPSTAIPSGQASQTEDKEAEQSPAVTQPSSNSEEQTPVSSAVASPSSEPAEAVDAPNESEEVSQTPIPSPPPKATPKPDTATPAADGITLSIIGNSEWGTVIAPEIVILVKGDTPAEVLKRAAKAHRLSYEIRGSGAMTYILGIDGLYEFDDGPTSGWKYRVNGKVADIGAGSYKLELGDELEWFYTSEDESAKEDKESGS